MLRIGIDLGGTKIAAGLVDENRVLGPSIQEPTGLPRPAGELAEAIYHLAYRLLKEQGLTFQDVECVGIGIPGTVNKETDCIEYANNFGFENVPFLKMLKELFPCPVYGENDAKAAAWGEYLAGAGRGSRSMTAFTQDQYENPGNRGRRRHYFRWKDFRRPQWGSRRAGPYGDPSEWTPLYLRAERLSGGLCFCYRSGEPCKGGNGAL